MAEARGARRFVASSAATVMPINPAAYSRQRVGRRKTAPPNSTRTPSGLPNTHRHVSQNGLVTA